MRRLLLAATAAFALFASSPARADLSQGDAFDALFEALEEYWDPAIEEWFIGEVIGWENFYYLRHWLSMVGAWGNSHLDQGGFDVVMTYPDPPLVYTPAEAEAKAKELYEDRALRVQEAMAVTSGIIQQNPRKQITLDTLNKMNLTGCAAAINPCIAAGNATMQFMAQEMVQNTNTLAQLSQVIVDDHMDKRWAVQLRNDRLKQYLGEYRWSGYRSFSHSTIPTPW